MVVALVDNWTVSGIQCTLEAGSCAQHYAHDLLCDKKGWKFLRDLIGSIEGKTAQAENPGLGKFYTYYSTPN